MLRVLLFPLAVIFNAVTRVRNYLYDRGLKPVASFDIPVILVGNLAVGGTGKTPVIEYLIRLLRQQHIAAATLSRGYGRKTKGFRVASHDDSALTLGDEPMQFYRKFGEEIIVAVGEERALAIPQILQEHSEVDVVLMDDGFQHRRVKPSFSILLTDYHRLFYEDLLMPAGRLREARMGARRADVIVVTKCPPELPEERMMEIEHEIRRYVHKPVFFSFIRYGTPLSTGQNTALKEKVILLTGIAQPLPLKNHLQHNYNVVEHIAFPDHHAFARKDIIHLQQRVAHHHDAVVMTTEKDWIRLQSPELKELVEQVPLFYLPIEVDFIKNGKDFDEMVLNEIKRAG